MKVTLSQVGTELTIGGLVLANGERTILCAFPDEMDPKLPVEVIEVSDDEVALIIDQLDSVKVPFGPKKTIVRKCERQLDSRITWKVFERDGYKCRYCGITGVPLTYDHVMLWEDGGPQTMDNGVTACRKCNKTRGNMSFESWIQSDYYLSRVPDEAHVQNINTAAVLNAGHIKPVKRKNRKRR